MTRLLLISAIAISLASCATGTELLTDQVYPAIEDPAAVSILIEMPEGAEQIAVLKASSGWESGQRERLEKVVEILKRRAAKVGANAVVLTGQDTTPWSGYPGSAGNNLPLGGWGTNKESLEGIAIFVR
jgi:type IV pilus biogenesis protein CpaD/CtpE